MLELSPCLFSFLLSNGMSNNVNTILVKVAITVIIITVAIISSNITYSTSVAKHRFLTPPETPLHQPK